MGTCDFVPYQRYYRAVKLITRCVTLSLRLFISRPRRRNGRNRKRSVVFFVCFVIDFCFDFDFTVLCLKLENNGRLMT